MRQVSAKVLPRNSLQRESTMKRSLSIVLSIGCICSVLLLLSIGLVRAQGFHQQPESSSGSIRSPHAQSPVSSAFMYQGMLKVGGTPVNNVCEMQFNLYDAPNVGTRIGTTITFASVQVVNGLSSMLLDFGNNAFDGSARWLQVGVRCPPGSGSFSVFSPRQPIAAAPYALSLKPGALVSGSVPNTGTLVLNNSDPSGYGLYGFNSSGGFAMKLDGNAAQVRDKTGWAKATARISAGPSPVINRCYNSQIITATAASVAPCSFDITRNGAGDYTINFGFQVDDRFFSITPVNASGTPIIPTILSLSGNQVRVQTVSISNTLTDTDFFIVIQ